MCVCVCVCVNEQRPPTFALALAVGGCTAVGRVIVLMSAHTHTVIGEAAHALCARLQALADHSRLVLFNFCVVVVVVGVVVAFSSLARIWGDCSTIHSPLALFLCVWRLVETNSTLYAKIGPQ